MGLGRLNWQNSKYRTVKEGLNIADRRVFARKYLRHFFPEPKKLISRRTL